MGKRHRIRDGPEELEEDHSVEGGAQSPSDDDLNGTPLTKSELKEKKRKKKRAKAESTQDIDNSTEKKKKKRKKRAESDDIDTSPQTHLASESTEKRKRGKSGENGESMQQGDAIVQASNSLSAKQNGGSLHIPTTEEILSKVQQKKKVFLNGPAAVSLLSPSTVQQLDTQEQNTFLTGTTAFCERLLNLMHDTISTGNAWKKSPAAGAMTTVEESLTNDLIRLKKVPLAKQYVEMNLWPRVVQFNKEHLNHASRIGYGKGESDTNPKETNGPLLHADGDPDATFVTFKDAHMRTIVERFGGDLEKMREAESMTADKVQFLLRCLESGASLFSNLKCLNAAEASDV